MKGKKWYTPRGTQSPNIGTHKEVEEIYLLCIVAPYLIRYYTHAVSMDKHQQQHHPRERRRIYSGIITIRMVPIGLYIIHRTWHTILIATSSQQHHHHEWSLHCHPCTKCINMTPSFQTINSITQLYVYGWNISVVNILGGTRT